MSNSDSRALAVTDDLAGRRFPVARLGVASDADVSVRPRLVVSSEAVEQNVGANGVTASAHGLLTIPSEAQVAEHATDEVVVTSRTRQFAKRGFDICLSAGFLILVASWLFPLIALAIRADSRGPALFRQLRVGLRGEMFTCLKFRTMFTGSESVFCQATRADPRVTRVGHFLRRTNLDELPQFINVLVGQMSLVGPRPHVRELDQAFADHLRHYRERHLVKPGITGLAQVLGHRGETRSAREMSRRIRLDRYYVRKGSFWLDLMIVLRTISVVIRGDENAY
jgi:putative colanic acid biosysnthesis UDP-glucose lipid carrier transferase